MGGDLDFGKIKEGLERVPEFQQICRVMDIQTDDLEQLFIMVDEDGSGEIDEDEFVNAIYRMKCGEGKTAALFTKQAVMFLKKELGRMMEKTERLESLLEKTV